MRPPGESLWRRHWRHQRTGPGEYFLRSEEHTSELQSRLHLVCRLLLEKNRSSDRTLSPDSTSVSRGDTARRARTTPLSLSDLKSRPCVLAQVPPFSSTIVPFRSVLLSF